MERVQKNYKSGDKCSVCSCCSARKNNHKIKLFKFPGADSVFGQICREKCQIEEQDFHKRLLICEKHFSSTYIGARKLKAEAIPTLHLGVDSDMTGEDFQFPPTPKRLIDHGKTCGKCKKQINLYKKKYANLLKKYYRKFSIPKKAVAGSKMPRSRKKVVNNLFSTIDTRVSLICMEKIIYANFNMYTVLKDDV